MKATAKTTRTGWGDEIRVRFFINGVHQAGADYFCDDKEEAKDAVKAFLLNPKYSDKTSDFAKDEAKALKEKRDENNCYEWEKCEVAI